MFPCPSSLAVSMCDVPVRAAIWVSLSGHSDGSWICLSVWCMHGIWTVISHVGNAFIHRGITWLLGWLSGQYLFWSSNITCTFQSLHLCSWFHSILHHSSCSSPFTQAHFLQRGLPDQSSSQTSLPSQDSWILTLIFPHSYIICHENIYTVVFDCNVKMNCSFAVRYASLSSLSGL